MASTPPTEEAFLREVDDQLRQEQMLKMWKHYGRIAVVAVVLALIAFGGYLYWRAESAKKVETQGEQLSATIADIQAGRIADATQKVDTLIAEGSPGYRVSALFTKAAMAAGKGDAKVAAVMYAQIVSDESAAQPFRDMALIRQTLLEYDTLKPDQVIARMKPLTVETNAFFGTAGELTAIAMLQSNRAAEAGRLLAAIARNKQQPSTLRARAARLASSLGVDVDAAVADKD